MALFFNIKCRKNPLGNLTGISLISQWICACDCDIVISWDNNHISLCVCLLLGIKISQATNLILVGFHHPIIGILLLMNIKSKSKNITTVYIQGLRKQTEILLVNIIPSCWSRILHNSYVLRNVSSGSVLTFKHQQCPSYLFTLHSRSVKFSGQYRWIRYSLKWKMKKWPTFIFDADVTQSM